MLKNVPFLRVLLLTLLLLLQGCSTVGYYSQIVSGHLKIVTGKKPVEKIVQDPQLNPRLRHRLEVAQQGRQFAIDELGLPDNGSYTTFYDLKRNYATWNVVAAGEFSFRPKRWCFPIAGCVSYRGYYAEADADAYADDLRVQGLDVAVMGATAYSTLGWFADPLLNTMLNRPDPYIVSLIIHELAHQQLYVGDDSRFNESFAVFVEQAGIERWQVTSGDASLVERLNQGRQRQREFVALLNKTRQDLEQIYVRDLNVGDKRQAKQLRYQQLRDEYAQLKAGWNGYTGYDNWFAKPINNARLVSVGTYNDYVPAFRVLFDDAGNDFARFYEAARELAEMPLEKRQTAMRALMERAPAELSAL